MEFECQSEKSELSIECGHLGHLVRQRLAEIAGYEEFLGDPVLGVEATDLISRIREDIGFICVSCPLRQRSAQIQLEEVVNDPILDRRTIHRGGPLKVDDAKKLARRFGVPVITVKGARHDVRIGEEGRYCVVGNEKGELSAGVTDKIVDFIYSWVTRSPRVD